MLPKISPMELHLVREAFDDPGYLFELKHDGFRGLAYIDGGKCQLISRRFRGLNFPSLAAALAKLPAENAIPDGEIICLDEHGVSQFNRLLRRKVEPVFYAFDLLWLDGMDLRELPLIERKRRLAEFATIMEVLLLALAKTKTALDSECRHLECSYFVRTSPSAMA